MLDVLGEDDLAVQQDLRQGGVLLAVVAQYLLGAGILLGHELFDLLVNLLGRALGVGLGEVVLLVVVVAEVFQSLAHAQVGNHAVGALGDALQVVEGAAGDMAREELFGGPSGQRGAHLVEHLLLGGDAALFGQVPGGTEGLSARHDGHLDQGVGIFQQPRYRGVSGLVDGDGAALVLRHHLRLLLQTADDAIDGIEEVLLAHDAAVVAGGDERRLVADVGDVGA